MKCTKCGYISFDFHDSCPKCNKDLSAERDRLNLAAYRPPSSPQESYFQEERRPPEEPLGALSEDGELTFEIPDETDESAVGIEWVDAPAEAVKPEAGATDFPEGVNKEVELTIMEDDKSAPEIFTSEVTLEDEDFDFDLDSLDLDLDLDLDSEPSPGDTEEK